MNTIYGHRQLNLFFKELFEMTDNGIKYKGKEYLWNDIKEIKKASGSYAVNLLYPGLKIYLNDKETIWINGRVFTKFGKRPHFNSFSLSFFTGESEAFLEFLELLEKKISKQIT